MPLCRVFVLTHAEKLTFYDARAVEGGTALLVYRDERLLARLDLFSVRSWWIEESAP